MKRHNVKMKSYILNYILISSFKLMQFLRLKDKLLNEKIYTFTFWQFFEPIQLLKWKHTTFNQKSPKWTNTTFNKNWNSYKNTQPLELIGIAIISRYVYTFLVFLSHPHLGPLGFPELWIIDIWSKGVPDILGAKSNL